VRRVQLAAGVVIGHFNQLHPLVLLKAFGYCAVGTTYVMTLATDLGNHTGLLMNVALAYAAQFFRPLLNAPLAKDQQTANYYEQHQRGV
jgi:hypothetical protein